MLHVVGLPDGVEVCVHAVVRDTFGWPSRECAAGSTRWHSVAVELMKGGGNQEAEMVVVPSSPPYVKLAASVDGALEHECSGGLKLDLKHSKEGVVASRVIGAKESASQDGVLKPAEQGLQTRLLLDAFLVDAREAISSLEAAMEDMEANVAESGQYLGILSTATIDQLAELGSLKARRTFSLLRRSCSSYSACCIPLLQAFSADLNKVAQQNAARKKSGSPVLMENADFAAATVPSPPINQTQNRVLSEINPNVRQRCPQLSV